MIDQNLNIRSKACLTRVSDFFPFVSCIVAMHFEKNYALLKKLKWFTFITKLTHFDFFGVRYEGTSTYLSTGLTKNQTESES